MNGDFVVEFQSTQQLRSQPGMGIAMDNRTFQNSQEILSLRQLSTLGEDLGHHVEDATLVFWIHALVDFVDTAERHRAQVLQSHQIEHRRHTALASRLHLMREWLEGAVLAELHVDPDSVLVHVVLNAIAI